MATIRYSSMEWMGMAWGITTETVCISLAYPAGRRANHLRSFIIFFGRKLDTVYF